MIAVVVLCSVVTDRRMGECVRAAAEDAYLLVFELGVAEQGEILMNALNVMLTATVIAFVVDHWSPAGAVAVRAGEMAGHSSVEAALHGQESYPASCSGPLRCFHSRSNSHSEHPLVECQSCLHSSTLFEWVVECI